MAPLNLFRRRGGRHQTDPRRGIIRRPATLAPLCRIIPWLRQSLPVAVPHAERTKQNGDEASVADQQRRPYRLDELAGFTEGLIAVSAE
jgi:hypothetical protein